MQMMIMTLNGVTFCKLFQLKWWIVFIIRIQNTAQNETEKEIDATNFELVNEIWAISFHC